MSRALTLLCCLLPLLPSLSLHVAALQPVGQPYPHAGDALVPHSDYRRQTNTTDSDTESLPLPTSTTDTESEAPSTSDTPTLSSTLTESSTSAAPPSSSDDPTSSAPSTSTSTSTPTPVPSPSSDPELDTMYARRLSSIIGVLGDADQVPAWLSTLAPNGKWPDSEVDYATGCEARRANWPAQVHWTRIVTMAAAWHGGVPNGAEEYVKDESLREAISRAVDYWFSRDFANHDCLDYGGTARCPCDNPDNWLWNTNWYSNIILIPRFVGQTCLILGSTLDATQRAKCIEITARSFQKFYVPINNVGQLTGANAIDVARTGMDNALLTGNVTLLEDAYRRVQSEMVIQNAAAADGIRADGAFGQHTGILYNGNYGKDFSNGLLDMEIEAAGTRFTASQAQQSAFGTLFDGNKWMIVYNTLTSVLHWDFSAIGRFLVFPVSDNQPTRYISMNLTKVRELGQLWGNEALTNFANGYLQPANNPNANGLVGNNMFFTNDYMVHRGRNYITTVKMWSTRTKHSECVNSANPMGYHLSDGVQYTYTRGDEYENVPGAWDWNLIPGITTDYGATPLTCANSYLMGVETFVGGVSDGSRGLAVMRYTNPTTRSLRWQKAWFFFDDDVEHVLVANVTSSNASAPVYSVLDQRRLSGPVQIDNKVVTQPTAARTKFRSLWHSNVGYTFENANPNGNSSDFVLNVQFGQRQGNWQAIGTSLEPPFTMDLFAAYVHHQNLAAPLAYTVYPAVTPQQFRHKSGQAKIRTVQNDGKISAAYDERGQVFMVVFWRAGGRVAFKPGRGIGEVTVSCESAVAVIYNVGNGDVSVADPGQALRSVRVTLRVSGRGRKPAGWGRGDVKVLEFELPQGGVAGRSVRSNVGSAVSG
ncbi:hypothetical protein AX16_008964 [Volvariella volvacea WC 439]|nr:hypothetical protein AX16_008964 [Volvariella volvacea WC 439]